MDTAQTPMYLNEMLIEIASFDETLFPPRSDVEPGEKVIGELPLWVKKAYAYAQMTRREYDELKLTMRYDGHTTDRCQRLYELDQRQDTILEIIWTVCRAHFGLWGCTKEQQGTISIRAPWNLVQSPPDPREMLKQLFEGRQD